MRVLLISTYELGRQPVHIASPAARLSQAGHTVSTLDVAVETLSEEALAGVDGVAISVPMHTAMRLAVATASRIRVWRPDLPIAFYGLYAGVGKEETLGITADSLFAGEYEPMLVEWADSAHEPAALVTDVSPGAFLTPARSTLPPPGDYARLEWEGAARVVGAVEASHGCRHRCRHCPIPVLYDGRMRVVGEEVVLSDIDQLVDEGVEHVTFGDPDFLNAPRYSTDLIKAAHRRHPHLTFDATVKVSHILQHRDLWPALADSGLLFVVSAFESVDQTTLEILDKGHTVADMRSAIDIVGGAGIHVRPTWLPFFPWTTMAHVTDLVGFIDEMGLWGAIDPVQLAIKLLIPEGSLLEKHPAVEPYLVGYEPSSFTWKWEFANEEVDALHEELEMIAARGSDCGEDSVTTLRSMRGAIADLSLGDLGVMPSLISLAPRLTESWFCCAEPTSAQAISVGLPARLVSLAGPAPE